MAKKQRRNIHAKKYTFKKSRSLFSLFFLLFFLFIAVYFVSQPGGIFDWRGWTRDYEGEGGGGSTTVPQDPQDPQEDCRVVDCKGSKECVYSNGKYRCVAPTPKSDSTKPTNGSIVQTMFDAYGKVDETKRPKDKTTCEDQSGCWIMPSNVCKTKGEQFDCGSSGCYTCSPTDDQLGYIQPPGKPSAAPPKDRPSCEREGYCWTGRACVPVNQTSKDGYCCAKSGTNGNPYPYTALVSGTCAATVQGTAPKTQGEEQATECSGFGNVKCWWRSKRTGIEFVCERINNREQCVF